MKRSFNYQQRGQKKSDNTMSTAHHYFYKTPLPIQAQKFDFAYMNHRICVMSFYTCINEKYIFNTYCTHANTPPTGGPVGVCTCMLAMYGPCFISLFEVWLTQKELLQLGETTQYNGSGYNSGWGWGKPRKYKGCTVRCAESSILQKGL